MLNEIGESSKISALIIGEGRYQMPRPTVKVDRPPPHSYHCLPTIADGQPNIVCDRIGQSIVDRRAQVCGELPAVAPPRTQAEFALPRQKDTSMSRPVPSFFFFCLTVWSVASLSLDASVLGATRLPPRPNVLMIMIDDLGWMDLRCQGNERLHTPNIDRLAREGMRFTDAYAAAPVCSPTRAAVLTGLSPARLHITNHIPDQKRFAPPDATLVSAPMLDHLPAQHETFPKELKSAGYATGFFGKWHLAGARKQNTQGEGDLRYYPEFHGFDVNHGGCAMGGPFSYFDPFNLHTLPPQTPGQYLPDRLADELIGFMRANRDRPFLGVLWNYTVHWPMEAPAELIKKYEGRDDLGQLDARYAAMIEAMDASVGRIMRSLDELELTDKTLILFTSDNGAFGGVADNRPLRAAKGYLYEGGIRVPQIVRWPGVVAAGSTCDTPVISMDFLPTIYEAAAVTRSRTHRLDGESLMPLLTQAGSLTRDAIYFHYPNYAFHGGNRLGSVIRQGRYKLIERFDDGSLELYDLANDLGETRNLAATQPTQAATLRARLHAWRQDTKAALPVTAKPE